MKRLVLSVLVLTILALPLGAAASECSMEAEEEETCRLHVTDLRPTQFSVGMVAVDCKRAEIEAKTRKKLKKWLKNEKRHVPAVIGPDGEFYITDHHHLATALSRADPNEDKDWGRKEKVMYVTIVKNYYTAGHVTEDQFWNDMFENHWAWMHDNKGLGPMNPMLLPADLGRMLNDPYRTLSRWVRESCGYLKSGKDQCAKFGPGAGSWFMEFYWANFLRGITPIASANEPVCASMPYTKKCLPNEVGALVMVYPAAMKAAESEQAKQYFESFGLDPVQYGFNASGQHLGLNISTAGCEDVAD